MAMWKILFSAAIKARFALWAIDVALPESSDLQRRYRSGLAGLMAAVAGGVLLACAAMGAMGGLGYALYYYSALRPGEAIAASVAGMLLLIVALFAYGRSRLRVAFEMTGSVKSSSRPPYQDPVKEALHGFLEGFATASPSSAAPETAEQKSALPRHRKTPYPHPREAV